MKADAYTAEVRQLRDRVEELEEQVRQYEALLAPSPLLKTAARRLRIYGLSVPVLDRLVKRGFVSREFCTTLGNQRDWTDADKFGHVAMFHIRRVLNKHGIVIKTTSGVGWFLDKEEQEKLKALLAAQVMV